MDAITSYIEMLIVSLIISIAIIGGILVYFVKFKKILAKEEKINYDNFQRKNATEYAKFDNIVKVSKGFSDGEFGIVVLPNHTFLAGMDIKGYNFGSASADERQRTMINSVSLFNTIDKPVVFRQSVKAIDISYNIKKHAELTKQLELRLYGLSEDYKDGVALYESYAGEPELQQSVASHLDAMQKEISSVKWQISEAHEVYKYLNDLERSTGKTSRINHMIFSYVFDASQYSVELKEEEIYMKAFQELSTKAGIYASVLENCGCKTRVLTDREMHDLIRRHNHPLTCDEIPIEKLYNSSYNALFVRSDDVLNLTSDKRKEARYQKEMMDYYKRRQQATKEAKERIANYTKKLEQAAENYIDSIEGTESKEES